MNTLLLVFQFERHSPKPWSQSQIQQIMTREHATYVSRGVYMLLASQTPQELLDEVVVAAKLTERDFVAVYPVASPWASVGLT